MNATDGLTELAVAPASQQTPARATAGAECCPVEALAVRAAEAVRLHRRLLRDQELINRVENDDHSPSIDELTDMLSERLESIEALASSLQARSRKGALFQAFVCFSAASRLADTIHRSKIRGAEVRRSRAAYQSLLRLLYSVTYAEFDDEFDDDLIVLREHYAPRSFYTTEVADRIAEDQGAAAAKGPKRAR